GRMDEEVLQLAAADPVLGHIDPAIELGGQLAAREARLNDILRHRCAIQSGMVVCCCTPSLASLAAAVGADCRHISRQACISAVLPVSGIAICAPQAQDRALMKPAGNSEVL